MSTLVRVLNLIAADIRRDLFDLATTGRTFVQAAFRT
jgi:hypothetical protein